MSVSRKKTARVNRAKVIASLAGAVLVIGSGAAQAERNIQTRTATVSYADLNLATPAGTEALYHRISAAARTVCGSPYERKLDVRRSMRDCNEAAISEALAELEKKTQMRAQLEVTGRGASD